MKAADLLAEIDSFRAKLREHQRLWGQSLDDQIPDFPIDNVEELREQSRVLNRQLGKLRPYIEYYEPQWVMRHPATGVTWNALESAISSNDVAQIKGPSLRTVLDRVEQICGRLEGLDPDTDVDPAAPSPTPATAVTSATAVTDPLNLERVSLSDLLRALGRLSLASWLAIISLIAGLVTITVAVTKSVSAPDPVPVDQASIDSLKRQNDSLAAVIRELGARQDTAQ